MKDQLKLSIIIPVYNMERYLQRCFDSVLNQKYPYMEIIVVDDGSTDNSLLVCTEYAKKDNRIHVIHKENQGLVAARKTGLDVATGQYITYVDADDWIEDKSYDELMVIASEKEPDLISCSFIKEFGELQTIRNDYPEEGLYSHEEFEKIVEETIEKKDFFCPPIGASLCCKVIRKEFLEKYQMQVPDDVELSEDFAVSLPMAAFATSIYISKRPYYHYCQNKSSMCWEWREGSYDRLRVFARHLDRAIPNTQGDIFCKLKLNAVYFAMMELLYDIPSDYFKNGIPFLKIKDKDSRIVIYGKGVYAANLINVIDKNSLFNIVGNVDSANADVLFDMNPDEYDYVVVAILDSEIVGKIKRFLYENGIEEGKIVCIQRESLKKENLPAELSMC